MTYSINWPITVRSAVPFRSVPEIISSLFLLCFCYVILQSCVLRCRVSFSSVQCCADIKPTSLHSSFMLISWNPAGIISY